LLLRAGLLGVFALLFMTLSPNPAKALNCAASINVIDYGSIDNMSSTPSDTTSRLVVTCWDAPAWYWVRVCVSISNRNMYKGSETLVEQLYSDAARTAVIGTYWANQTGIELVFQLQGNAVGSGAATIYGRIPTGQTSVSPGTFSGTVDLGYSWALAYSWNPCTYSFVTGNGGAGLSTSAWATIPARCVVNNATLDFGSAIKSLKSAIDASTTVSITCSKNLPIRVRLGGGLAWNAGRRRMTNGTAYIEYNLYKDAARSQFWGNTANADDLSATGTGVAQTVPVYGRTYTQSSTPKPGAYSDSIVISVDY
jgi:spore coat protein U-like protein